MNYGEFQKTVMNSVSEGFFGKETAVEFKKVDREGIQKDGMIVTPFGATNYRLVFCLDALYGQYCEGLSIRQVLRNVAHVFMKPQ